jgi:hypothetical protein
MTITNGWEFNQSPYQIEWLVGFHEFMTSRFHASALSSMIYEMEKFQSHKTYAILPLGFDQRLRFQPFYQIKWL